MNYVFAPAAQAVVPVLGTDLVFPVHRIYCVGRNYVEHAKEMGGTGREAPFFFSKPADAVVAFRADVEGTLAFPASTRNLHHEIELVVALHAGGSDIATDAVAPLIYGYAVGIDLTRRDLQDEAKDKRRPWDTAKGFDASAPLGELTRAAAFGTPVDQPIWLDVNGRRRQEGHLGELIWNVAETISALSRFYRLTAGDLIFTGTPKGVGPIEPGDLLEGGIGGLAPLRVRIGERPRDG